MTTFEEEGWRGVGAFREGGKWGLEGAKWRLLPYKTI